MEWVGFGGKGRVSELLPVPLPHPHCQELTAGVISDLWPVGPSCWGGRGSCSRLSGTHVRDTSHGMAPVQLFPLGSRGRSCCQAGSQYELREGCRLPAPSRTHLATAEAQSSAGSMNPPGSPLNRGLADPSGCLGVLAQPCRDVVLRRCSPLLELPPDCHRTRAYTRARAESQRGHPALPRAPTVPRPHAKRFACVS